MTSAESPDDRETLMGPTVTGTAGAAQPEAPAAGVVLDRYTILEKLGAGGMGEVYAAYDSKLDRKVALKLLKNQDEQLEARLLREAQAMARLAHPNVVAVFDTGHALGRLYLAMEFVRGQTLRTWQKGSPRSVAELLRAYGEAGHGLAAAHDAGLVHRDFKPDNVLVAEDGRIKVTDFGIARAVESDDREESTTKLRTNRTTAERETPPSAVPSSGSLENPMTAEGTLLGTPGYMAPEQFLCESLDARTDQFSFCVSLYEALYGERPFAPAGSRLDVVARATLLGKVHDPPKGTAVPGYVRRVLLRGLLTERDARYPSMRALLEELADDPAQSRRRLSVATAAALVATALGAAGVAQYRHVATGRALVCKGSEEALSRVWDRSRKEQVRQAFVATGSPIAADTWPRVERAVDAYASSWVGMRTEACEATRVRGLQSDEAMTLRMTCLDRRREGLKAYVDVYSSPDPSSVEHAVQAALALTPIEGCADVATLRMAMPPPENPVERAKLEALRPAVAELKALYDSGKYEEAVRRAEPAIREAEAIHFRPVEAELRFWSANSLSSARKTKEAEAEDVLALWAALAGGHHEVAVRASALLASDLGRLSRENEALRAAEYGRAILERMGPNPELEGELELALGLANYQTSPREALRHDQRARELWEKAFLPDRPELGVVYHALVSDYIELGDFEKAAEFEARAVSQIEGKLGPDHPSLANPLGALGNALKELARYDEAERHLHRALRLPGIRGVPRAVALEMLATVDRAKGRFDQVIAEDEDAERELEKDVGEHPRFTPDLLITKSAGLSAVGRHDEALAAARRALTLREAHFAKESPLVAEAYNAVGFALSGSGKPALAIPQHEKALAIATAAGSRFGADAWMGIAEAELLRGHFAPAAAGFERALALMEARIGKDHPDLAEALTGLGRAEVARGHATAAIPPLERAVTLADRADLSPKLRAEARFALARATWESGARDAAKQLALAARRDARAAGVPGAAEATRIERWLTDHR